MNKQILEEYIIYLYEVMMNNYSEYLFSNDDICLF